MGVSHRRGRSLPQAAFGLRRRIALFLAWQVTAGLPVTDYGLPVPNRLAVVGEPVGRPVVVQPLRI